MSIIDFLAVFNPYIQQGQIENSGKTAGVSSVKSTNVPLSIDIYLYFMEDNQSAYNLY